MLLLLLVVLKLELHREGRAHQLVEFSELMRRQPVLHLRIETINEAVLLPSSVLTSS